ncbi:MAG: 4-hydroxy-3-methylbut-2-enyl diphosphate reductase [Acidobacteria bacterium]|nr:4-hydroxy-3-methylbut-2-enyl diphosphate reductase [Acidobacteriota bacterium]
MAPDRKRRLILASPRGFCAGVERAIDIVNLALDTYGKPLYVRREIVHNVCVVSELRTRGVAFVEELEEVPEGSRIIFSAHGVSPEVRRAAAARRLKVIDATCPLVMKVHSEADRYAREGFTIILIGHADHDEVIGTIGEAPLAIKVLGRAEDVDRLSVPDPEKVAYLTQTTLSLDDTRQMISRLRARFPHIQGPPSDDICYATQNRQHAVKELARRVQLVLVVGSSNSSNSRRLVEVAVNAGVRAHLIGAADELRLSWFENAWCIGLTAGASVPERLVEEVIGRLRELGFPEPEHSGGIVEDVQFALPPDLVRDSRACSPPAFQELAPARAR